MVKIIGDDPTGPGVLGTSDNGTGVQGYSSKSFGVSGFSTNYVGVFGESPNLIGVSGTSDSGTGVEGTSANGTAISGTSINGTAVSGTSTNGTGVSGTSGKSFGVSGFSTDAPGVVGTSTNDVGVSGSSPNRTGVYGSSDNDVGVQGYSIKDFGVYGTSSDNAGIVGLSRRTGVIGISTGVHDPGTDNIGILGYSEKKGLAGGFLGNVAVSGQLHKGGGGFRIDHPLDPANMYLFHSFVESPDMKNLYDGIAVLDAQGEAVVDLPLWFEALNQEFRYQLTSIGAAGPNLYIAEEISNRRFKIAGGVPDMKVCWQVTGSRKDAFAQANPLVVEQEKPIAERGRYLHPELYGHSVEQSITWVHHPEILRRVVEEQKKTRED